MIIMKRLSFLLIILLLGFTKILGQSMEWLCRPDKYKDIEYMGHDLFKVRADNGKWGVISADGKEVLKIEQDSITPFVENRALLLDKTGKRILGIIGTEGELINSFEDKQIYTTSYPYYKEGLMAFKIQNGLCGYLNYNGNISIQPKFYLAAPFQNGIATVQYADGDGYYGLINKSGGSAIITDVQYKFLSSMVNGLLYAVTSTRNGDLLRVMELNGNQLKGVKRLESKMFVDLSDDFRYLMSQNGHHYFIDNQWRISGSNYNYKLPYELKDSFSFITESSELLSKQETKNGIQITYMGKPILEHAFNNVETYEKKYAIVSAKDKSIGVLKLNPSAGIEIIAPTRVVDFYHNPLPINLSANLDEITPTQYVEAQVDLKDVNPSQLKCYINDNGYLRYAPLKKQGELWKLNLPYFYADTKFGNVVSNDIDVAITYDGLEWMHRRITISSKHESGFNVQLDGNSTTNSKGKGNIFINIKSINGIAASSANVEVSGPNIKIKQTIKDQITIIPVTVYVPEGDSKTFSYTITIREEGCPTIKKTLSKTISNPNKKQKTEKIIVI